MRERDAACGRLKNGSSTHHQGLTGKNYNAAYIPIEVRKLYEVARVKELFICATDVFEILLKVEKVYDEMKGLDLQI